MWIQPIGLIAGDTGRISTTIIKYIVVLSVGIILLAMIRKYQVKKNILTRNLTIMFVFYMIAPIFASFDIIFNWADLPQEGFYLGNACANFFSAWANIFYLWFVLAVFYDRIQFKHRAQIFLSIMTLGELGATTIALIFHFTEQANYFPWVIIHGAFTLIIYSLSTYFALVLWKRLKVETGAVPDTYRHKVSNMIYSGLFALGSLIFFVIDQVLTPEVTIFSLIGWLGTIGLAYYMYRSYV